MKLLLTVNDLLLFICASMYLGTGWSLILFQYPQKSQITPENYYLIFVPPVKRAATFFTWMTSVMLVFNVVMIVSLWGSALIWLPIVVLLAIVAATVLTLVVIFPVNKILEDGVTDKTVLDQALDRWTQLNWVRVSLWTVEWLGMAAFFGIRAF